MGVLESAAVRTADIVINFPFTLVIEHGSVDLAQMFEISKTFDLYEMEADLSDQEGLVKENVLVDVLEVTPTSTTVKITPAQPMPYLLVAKHTELMIKQVAKRLWGGKYKILRLAWEIDKTGVASDLRGILRKVI